MPGNIPVALTIAGSDSGGGAGIQADLKTFAFHRVHGTVALTCVTAQNTQGVTRVDALTPEAVMAQIEAVQTDIGFDSLKTGMLLNAEIIDTVSQAIAALPNPKVVVDPVMVSRTGAILLEAEAIAAMQTQLIPLGQVLTPNRYEAEILSGISIHSEADIHQAAQAIFRLGCPHVLIKGGGFSGELRGIDFWYDGERILKLQTHWVNTPHTHGTGCSLSAAIAANLALGYAPGDAAQRAKDYVTCALGSALSIGQGQGPIGHWYPLLKQG
ncbi:bifunctional hydroxymethylpyrimidine kinase/phosphomethylpyrimidine kinase [Aphanocapsa montana]|uniref:bifunctional hydroxymethylpyrimidine kinase/phosphomethylpyrimidine kinase n=1 Tax=Lyngbya confervoides TaxID=207921 RepID=UPI0019116BBB